MRKYNFLRENLNIFLRILFLMEVELQFIVKTIKLCILILPVSHKLYVYFDKYAPPIYC